MIQYKLHNDPSGNLCSVSIVGQNLSIPADPDNTDYAEYLEWLAEGNTPLPADDDSGQNT
jgi:hypothetical protein